MQQCCTKVVKRLRHETTAQTTKEMLHDFARKFDENQTLSNIVQHRVTSCNIVQQGGQTDATCMLRATMFARCCMKCCIRLTGALRLVFTSDGSRSRREPYALVKTARNKQKQKKKETFPFSSFFFYFCFCFCFRR